jgi:protein O-mannosyl-transferase
VAQEPIPQIRVPQPLPAASDEFRRQIGAAVVLALITFSLYYQVIHHPFSNYDDGEYVGDNARIHHGLTLATLRWALTSTEHANWHPVTWLSHALDWRLFGPMAAGHHFTSLLLHVLNVVLLFFFLVRVTRSARSLAVAALFALHPINVESVAWIAERKNVLCTFFFLLALLAYAGYARRPNVGRYLLVAVLYVFGLAAKPMVVTFPFVLLLLDYWPMQRIQGLSEPSPAFPAPQFAPWKLVLEKLPLLLLSVGGAVLTVIAQRQANAIRPVTAFPFWLRIENAIFSYATYLWKTIWPVKLAVLYPYPAGGIAVWRLVLAALVLLAITAWVWRDRERRPYLLTGWLWFLGMMVPVIGLVQVGEQGMADRYAYLPLIGVFIMVVWLAIDLTQNADQTLRWSAAAAAGVVFLALALLTYRQIGFWNTNYDLWAHTAAVTDNNVDAEDVAGSELLLQAMNKGLSYSPEAQVHFQRALKMNPNDSEALMDIGADLQAHGKVSEALADYNLALKHVEDNFLRTKILSETASAYEQMGNFLAAREYYRQALQVAPSADSTDFIGYARTFTDEQIVRLSSTLAKHPTAKGYLQLGQLQDAGNYIAGARESYQRAIELDPNLDAARIALKHDSKAKR